MMKYCDSCHVRVDNPEEHCPLCYAYLSQSDDTPEVRSYPAVLQQAERYNIIQRLLVVLSLTIAVVCLTVNLMTSWQVRWSLIVIGNILYMRVDIGTAVRRRTKLGNNILI